MNDTVKDAKKAACFFAAMTVMLTALCWLVYGISDNIAYKRYVGRITDISKPELLYEDPDRFRVTYEFYTESGTVQKNFQIADFERVRYSAGDEYAFYYREDWDMTMSEGDAQVVLKCLLIIPLIFFIPSFMAVLAVLLPCLAKAEQIIQAARAFPICFGLSVVFALLPAAIAVYAAVNYEESIFRELTVLIGLAAAAMVCIDSLIVQAIAWIISIYINKRKLDIREVGKAKNAVHTG